MTIQPILSNIKETSSSEGEGGQALVEMLVIMMICLMIGIGIYEAGSFFHNIAVINKAVETGSVIASHGAPYEEVQRVVEREAGNLLAGAFLSQHIPEKGIIVEVWNPVTGNQLAPTQQASVFPPQRSYVAENMFRAQGYEVRVGVIYRIGIYLPFLKPITVDQTIVGTRTIQSPNDVDRDGMADSQEVEYLAWRAEQDGNSWKHPAHRDDIDTMDTDKDADVDGDGLVGSSDTRPYDFNNNNTEDRFDEDNRSGPRENKMNYNPVVGPNNWPVLP